MHTYWSYRFEVEHAYTGLTLTAYSDIRFEHKRSRKIELNI